MAEEIFPVMDYAWVDEDTPSNDYLGLAIWSSDAPFKLDIDWDRAEAPPEPTKRDEIFHKTGEDS